MKSKVIVGLLVLAFAMSAVCIPVSIVRAESPDLIYTYGDTQYEYYDNNIRPNDFLTSEEIQLRKLNAPFSQKVDYVSRLVRAGASEKDSLAYCFPNLTKLVERIKSDINATAQDAEIRFYPDRKPMFDVKRSRLGYEVNENAIYKDTLSYLCRGIKYVSISVRALSPTVSTSDLIACTKKRATFSTSYAKSSDKRKRNVVIAMSKINGVTIKSGETFSFNSIVGARTEQNGFQTAKIIVNGKYTYGVGGGVCPASTTVYNCALRAGLTIVEARRHTLVPTYVEPSFDAMVSGASDLKFRNDFPSPVFIRTFCDNSTVNCEMYSTELPYDIECRSVTLSCGERPADEEFLDVNREYTQGLASGEKIKVLGGAPALKSEGYIVKKYPNGKVEEYLIRRDEYAEAVGRVAIAP